MESIFEKALLTIAIAFLFAASAYLVYDLMQDPPKNPFKGEGPLDSKMSWDESLCMTHLIRNPGGLSSTEAEICYAPEFGWTVSEVLNRLLEDDYQRIAGPMFREIRRQARSMGVYNEDHNIWIYKRRLRNSPDSYLGRS